jgi:hypothetical protein
MALLQKAYLGATPLFRNTAWFEDNSVSSFIGNFGINVTTGSTAHVKGSWTQLIASTSANASLLLLNINNLSASATNSATLLDIGTGASTFETVVIPNIAIGGAGSGGIWISIPLKIPSGTRLAARAQSARTSATFRCDPFLYDCGDYATAPTSYGAADVMTPDTSTSQGISFSGASGTWVEAIASTDKAYRGVILVPSTHDTDIGNFNATLEVGVGADTSEVAFGALLHAYLSSEVSRMFSPIISPFGRGSVIPAGSRLAVRHNIAANPSKYGFCLIGIP